MGGAESRNRICHRGAMLRHDPQAARQDQRDCGVGGRAEVVIARRSLISIAFDPIRQLRENLAYPPERRAPGTDGNQ